MATASLPKPKPVSTARQWKVEEIARNIHRIDITLERVGDEQAILCQSDVHWDNPKCDRETFEKHLKLARIKDAPILDNGDFYCCMQGKYDRRANKDDLRPEHRTARYFDSLIDTAADDMAPYADLLTIRGQGNHETAILKNHETNLTERFVERMRANGAPNIHTGGYSGFVIIRVTYGGTCVKPFKLFYHHGHGGGGAVTRGVIQTNRQAVYLADADLVWTGHTHDTWQVPIARVRLNQDCTDVEHTRQMHYRTAGYKEEYGSGYGGWHVERGGPPKPVGAAWLVFRHESGRKIDYDLIEAK
jgi:hypothetical protein